MLASSVTGSSSLIEWQTIGQQSAPEIFKEAVLNVCNLIVLVSSCSHE